MMPNRLASYVREVSPPTPLKPSVSIKNALTGLPPPAGELDGRRSDPYAARVRLHAAADLKKVFVLAAHECTPKDGRLARACRPHRRMIANGSRCARRTSRPSLTGTSWPVAMSGF